MTLRNQKHLLCLALMLASPGLILAQTCTITSPTSNQVVMPPVSGYSIPNIQFSAVVSSAPAWYRIAWFVRGKYWASGYVKDPHHTDGDFRDFWQGPGTVTYPPGLPTDGAVPLVAQVQDIFGNVLATCSTTWYSRMIGLTGATFLSVPTSGTSVTVQATGYYAAGGGQNSTLQIDGRNDTTTGCYGTSTGNATGPDWFGVNTTCFINGPHEFYVAESDGPYVEPALITPTFTGSNVTGNDITLTAHTLVQNATVVFATTGTLPAPLVAGKAFFWTTSPSNSNTATVLVSGSTMTFTCNSACGAASGTPIFVRNIASTNQTTGQPNCDGYYRAASGSGTTLVVASPSSCPNGALASGSFELWINPYFVQYIDGNTISVSANPGGATLPLTTAGTGTNTVIQRLRSPFYTDGLDDDLLAQASTIGPAFAIATVTLNNGAAPMELRPPYWELHMVAGGPTVSVCPKVANTDGTSSTLACNASGLSYTEVDDGGSSGVCSVDVNGNVTASMAGWCKVKVACSACAFGSATLPTVTVYAQVESGSVSFPHFNHAGPILNSFAPGSSFFPLGLWHLNVAQATSFEGNPALYQPWLGPMMQQAALNSSMTSTPATNLADPTATTCPNWSTVGGQPFEQAFATQYGTYFEMDLATLSWNPDVRSLAAILNNTGYNRQSCLQSYVSGLVSFAHNWRFFVDDEYSFVAGPFLMPNPGIGGPNWTNAATSGGMATFNVQNINTPTVWNQSSGAGTPFKVSGATNNPCLNGWYLPSSITGTSWTAPTTCGNGLTITSTSDPGAQLTFLFSPAGCNGDGSGCENTSAIPSNLSQIEQPWSAALTQMTRSGSTLEVYWTGHSLSSGTAVRIHAASTTNLNILAPITVMDANHFTITYPGTAGGVAPTAGGPFNSTTDPNLFMTVDPGFPPNSNLNFRQIVNAVTGHPAWTWSMLGNLFNTGNLAGVYSFMGNPINTEGAFDYIPQSPNAIYGDDASVWSWANYSQSTSGLVTRAYQRQPRSMLWSIGIQYTRHCVSFQFNPGCDRPDALWWRPETLVAQLMGMLTLDVSALRGYNFEYNMTAQYGLGLGYAGGANVATGGNAINPFVQPKQWAAMAHTNALIKRMEKYHLEPPMNKPYYGPFFLTDAHTSSYGNELLLVCASEVPYQQTVDLSPIRLANGTMRRYSLSGYRLTMTLLPSNPASDTYNFCSAAPGETVVYLSQPQGAVSDADSITFGPPAALPFGASKFLVQVGYFPRSMLDDPVTDCTSACTIAVDHHNAAAWYRVIYADSNGLPLSAGDPVQIPSQGLN